MDGKFDFSTPITSDITLNAMWNCSNIDPNNPTFANLKLALATSNPSAIYPLGTLVPDKYNNTAMNWRIVHYGKAIDGATGGELTGAYLMMEKSPMTANMSNFWAGSTSRSYINPGGSFYNSYFSAEVKAVATPIIIKSVQNTTVATSTDSFFSPSAANLGGENLASWNIDEWWDYFKQKMGGVTAWTVATPGRVLSDTYGTAINYWLRDGSTSTYGYLISSTGSVNGGSATQAYNVFPCFFMSA